VTFPASQEELSNICPYLGLADDADSHATYATEAHRCYRLDTPTRIAPNHQETYCLGANHVACPVYRGEGIGGSPTPAAAGGASAAFERPAPPRRPPERPAAPRGRPPERQRSGALNPRPRSGGISLPVATIGLFVLAIVVIALAFWIQSVVGDDDDGQLSPDEIVATNQARQTEQTTPSEPGDETTTPTTPQTQPGGSTQTPGAGGTQTPGGGGTTYTVVSGDTCISIAEANGVTLEELLEANNMTEDDCTSLNVGDELVIP
jgi:LysM repeat protein